MSGAALLARLEACERQVWDALLRGDAAADAAALAEDFLGVYPDGFSDRAGHVAQLAAGASVTAYALSDLRVLPLADGLALLAYHARYRRVGRDADEEMYVSSIWRRAGDGWVNLFSQDTPAGDAVP